MDFNKALFGFIRVAFSIMIALFHLNEYILTIAVCHGRLSKNSVAKIIADAADFYARKQH